MSKLTSRRVNGIKYGYWSVAKKDELIDKLGPIEEKLETDTRTTKGKIIIAVQKGNHYCNGFPFYYA